MFKHAKFLGMIFFTLAGLSLAATASGRDFAFGGVTLDLQEITTNADVYYTAMRYNRAAAEWDVNVTVSNKTSQAFSGPLVLLIDSYTGTAGPLRADGVSGSQSYFDLSGQLNQGILGPGSNTTSRTISMGYTAGASPAWVARIFAAAAPTNLQALGFARSLNEVGQPLPNVAIQESGPNGNTTNVTDGEFGVVTLGHAPGNYTWQFSLAGYEPVWRQAVLSQNSVSIVPFPRLVPRSLQSFGISPLTGGMATNQTIQLQFAGGSFSQVTPVEITPVDGQTLPAFLPLGWSPLQAFWLDSGGSPAQPITASLTPWGPIGITENAYLVEFNPAAMTWQVLQLVLGNGVGSVSVSLPGNGAYALVVADAAPIAPPTPSVGNALQSSGVATPNPARLLAGGTVTPSSSPASTVPELVTAAADVGVTNLSGPLASGTLLHGEVNELYLLEDGTTRVPPLFDNYVAGYQRPYGTPAGTIHADFPIRPLLLLDAQTLNVANVHVDLYAPGTFLGGVLDTNGGLVASDPIRVLAGPNVFSGQQAIQLQTLAATNFTGLAGTNFTVAAAFQLAVGQVVSNELSLAVAGVPTNQTFVLARVIDQNGLYGLEPRDRLHSDAVGNLFNDEPAAGGRLPGLTVAGQYVLLQVNPQQGLVEGVATDSSGQATNGLPVTITGQPWLTFSAQNGSYKLLAPSGTNGVTAMDLATGDTGTQPFIVPANLAAVTAAVGVSQATLNVVSLTPSDTSSNVPVVTSVTINFSRAINPSTLVTNTVQLMEGTNVVSTIISLNLADTTVTLLPNGSLDNGAQFQVLLATNITDTIGRPLTGQSSFTFNTVPVSTRDPAAQLIIYEPGATNLDTNVLVDLPGYVPGTNQNEVVVHGTPGVSDPGVPVVIVNEASGQTSTVIAKEDGSFTSWVDGQAADFISATFISLNGARIYVPVNRQIFDDGSVGLYSQGGSLQSVGDGGAIQITVPPNAIPTRTKFKLSSITAAELQSQLGGVVPTNGTVAGSALNLNISGDVPTLPVQVNFPVDLSTLGYPTNEAPTNACAALAVVQNTQDVTTYQVMDQLLFNPNTNAVQNSKMGTRPSRPSPKGGSANDQITAGFLDSSTGLLLGSAGPAGQLALIGFNQVLVPLLFGPRPVVIKGLVKAIPTDVTQIPGWGSLASQLVNGQSGNELLDVSLQIAQQMGLPNVYTLLGPAGNIAQSYFQVQASALQLQELQIATPLRGAFITVSLSGGPLVNEPGRLNPGMVYATSGSDGTFLTVAPAAGAQYIITCTDPQFEEVQTQPANPLSLMPGSGGDLTLAGAVFKNFLFQVPLVEQTPPVVSVSSVPVQPGAGQLCQLIINASSPAATPKIAVKVVSVGTTNLLTGLALTNVVLTQSTPVPQTNGLSATWSGTFSANQPVLVSLSIIVQGQNGFQNVTIPYSIAFTGPVPVNPVSNIPKPDTNDVHGPLVMQVLPVNNGVLGQNSEIDITFNKPIDSSVTNNLGGVTLNGVGTSLSPPPPPVVRLSPDQQTLSLEYLGLPPGGTYQLTLTGQSIRDLAGQPLSQNPNSTTPTSFSTTFRTIAPVTTTLSAVANGKGAVISGTHLFVLDQAPSGNYLDSFDITQPLNPVLLNQYPLYGMPRDLVVIPQFGYKQNATTAAVTNDIVAVVGGDLGALIDTNLGDSVTVPGQYLWVFNMGNPASPQILASPIVSYRVGSAVTKVRWAPPFLAYEEYGSDIQEIGLVNLQELIYGFGSSLAQIQQFGAGTNGVDLNGTGSYTAPGDTLPIPPSNPPEFFGKQQSYVLQNTTQGILDFSVTPGAGTIGVTLQTGSLLDAQGNVLPTLLPPMYRTLAYNGSVENIALPTDSMYAFGLTAYPRWVSVFNSLPILSQGTLTTISVALVTLQPDTNGLQSLEVLNITLPQSPQLLNTITIPASILGGNMESVVLRPDGLLQLAGQQNAILLNPQLLGIPTPSGQLSQAIVGVIPNAGSSTHSFGSTTYGVSAESDGGRTSITISPPQIEFVSFPGSSGLINTAQLAGQSDSAIQQALKSLNVLTGLAPANISTNLGDLSDLEPPNPALHYYALMFAPGGSGNEIDLGLESLNPAGKPLANLGHYFAPVRAISPAVQQSLNLTPKTACGAPIRQLPAYQVSNNPKSPYYNWYLSRPFALVTSQLSLDDLTRIQADGIVDREILFSGAQLRAFIDPGESTAPAVGAFAAQADPQRMAIFPVAQGNGYTVNRAYLTGNNPPPPGTGATPFEDTYGTVQSHSGEMRISDVDMSLPSPHMSMSVVRTIGNQDAYEGQMGVGWDFNYNQRLTILDPLTFPQGLQMPLVVRDNLADSDIAGSQDILFTTGGGQVYHFVWQGTNPPAVFSADPLFTQFDYKDLVSDYYLPQHGMFDLMVKFLDGRFERLTPDGVRYRYTSDGRLESIIDRFPQNQQVLQYDQNEWLVQVTDSSVSAPRYIQFGHYRAQNTDPDFVSGLDLDAGGNPSLLGKICRVRDYTGRDVLYQYDPNGYLITVMGLPVNGENNGFAGRCRTDYNYTDCQLSGITATVNGIPIISSVNASGPNGKPIATSTSGSIGSDAITVPTDNSAANVGSQTTGVKVGDGSSISRTFDKYGNVSTTTITGITGGTATEVTSNTPDGLLFYDLHPEGNWETITYDSGNAVFRSRGNRLSMTKNPGPRGGPVFTETYHYDPRYNLPSGDQVDANGFHTTYTLTSDGLSVAQMDFGGVGTRTAAYNSAGQMTQSVNEDGVIRNFTYDPNTGFMDTESSGGITYTYTYDSSVPSQLGKPASLAPPVGTPTVMTYNNNLQQVEVTRGDLDTTFAYDELGRQVYRNIVVGGGKQMSTTYAYDNKGFVTNSTVSGVEVNGVDTSYSTTYVPDPRLRVQKAFLPNGTEQQFTYDNRGNVTEMKMGDYAEDYTYDLNNNRISVTQGGDLVSTTTYDGLDRVSAAVRKTGAQGDITETSTYWAGGEAKTDTITDPAYGPVSDISYDSIDAFGRHLIVTRHGTAISPQYNYTYGSLSSSVAGPRETATTTWDTAGNQTGYTDPILKMTNLRDADGRVYEVDRVEDGATYSLYMGYDDLDHQTSLGDLLGAKFNYTPRADGCYLQIKNARGNTTTLDYTSMAEMQSKKRADGMEVDYRHDTQRQLIYQGDPGAGFNYGFDSDLRMTNSSLRNGTSILFGGFDVRNMPTTLTIPGGTETVQYDLQRRMTQRKITYQGMPWEEDYIYDALNRVRSVTYVQNGGPNNTATYTYDPAGPLLAAQFNEDNATFNVSYGYYSDGARNSIVYPSGITVTETRDATGRLTGLSDGNGSILNAVSWQGDTQPKEVQIGANLDEINTYDPRGRETGMRVTRTTDNAVLVHMRYNYDGVNNVTARQYIHRGGKADNFTFDTGERLSRAQVGAVPLGGVNFSTPLYDRSYNYHASGLDYLVDTTMATNLTSAIPDFATNWSAHDDFLQPTVIDGFVRGNADPLGNTGMANLRTRPAGATTTTPVSSILQHDGLGRLVSVTETNGVTVQYQYQAGGLRFSRKVLQNGQLTAYSAFVYDSMGHLLEEYDRSGATNVLIGRYYYGNSDAPVAADLMAPGSGLLKRYYYLRDASQSVVAMVDGAGLVQERVWYDPHGSAVIEERDTSGPKVSSITGDTNGLIYVVLSEPVLPYNGDPGVGGGVVPFSVTPSSGTLTVSVGSTNMIGAVDLLPFYSNAPPYSVVRFTPGQTIPVSNVVSVALSSSVLFDEWGNGNISAAVQFTNGAGLVYYTASPVPQTAAKQVARSALGSPFLYQGQYFDYDAGLAYFRARYYDPYAGSFLEPDPLGYEDSVNNYAAMMNNPVSLRDPSGLASRALMSRENFHAFLRTMGYSESEHGLIYQSHATMSRMGMGDLELAAHIRVMFEQYKKDGTVWEWSIRKFGNPEARIEQVDKFIQGKPEEVSGKSDPATALVIHKGLIYTSDLDGLYGKRNGEVATLEEVKAFQQAVNDEIARLTPGWRELAAKEGRLIMSNETQKGYQHGISLNIPQEYGTHNDALKVGGTMDIHVFDWIESKMKKGTGEAFSFGVNGRDSIQFNENVDVNSVIRDYENFYNNVLFNPGSSGFNAEMFNRIQAQYKLDGRAPALLFPKTFYGHSYGLIIPGR
jgi:RHS repeat-associated protein